MNGQYCKIPTCDLATNVRNVVNPMLKHIEWGMQHNPRKYLESGTWDMSFAFDEDAKKRWEALTDKERELAYEWLGTMLREEGWTLSPDRLNIIPFDSAKEFTT